MRYYGILIIHVPNYTYIHVFTKKKPRHISGLPCFLSNYFIKIIYRILNNEQLKDYSNRYGFYAYLIKIIFLVNVHPFTSNL